MKFVFASYVQVHEYKDPGLWLERTRAYGGILKALSVHHEVISIEQIAYSGSQDFEGIHYHFLKAGKSAKYLPFELHRFIKAQQPDVVVIHGLHFPLQIMQLRLALGKKVAIILQNHAEKPFTGVKKIWQRMADNFVDAYFFASHEMGLEWIAKGNLKSAGKIHEVMELSSVFHPVSKDKATLKTGVNCTDAFLWVGRLNQNKDPLNVVNAFLKFSAIQSSACLYMIYHTDELVPEIKMLLAGHPGNHAIKLIGRVPNDELLWWYNSIDFIVSGSHYEGSGTAICEAMSCGCIPVVTDIFSFRMITDSGSCGILYEAGNEDALLRALLETNRMNKEEKRKLCLDYFQSNLSFKAIAARFESIAATIKSQKMSNIKSLTPNSR